MNEASKNTAMRNANIRITKTNIVTKDYPELGLKAGDTYEVLFEDIVNELKSWSETKKLEYFAIEHYENPDNIHYHIVIIFDKNSQAKFLQIKERFPFGNIERCKYGVANSIKYLVHLMNPEKYAYDFDDVVTNSPATLEKYKIMGSTCERKLLDHICDMIIAGKIKEYQIEKISSDIFTKHRRRIENAFEYRRKLLLSKIDRNITAIYIQGPPGVGKSTFCKAYAKLHDMSIKFSSSGRHPLEGFGSEDILVLDDVNYGEIPIQEMLNILDPNTNYEIAVRYKRVLFTGQMIFICSNRKISDWYFLEDQLLQDALYRRIQYVLDFSEIDDNNVAHYTINKVKTKTPEEKSEEYEKYKLTRDSGDCIWYEDIIKRDFEDCYRRIYLKKIAEKDFDLKPYINGNKKSTVDFLQTIDDM